jgi:hypothetical protein
VVNVYDPTERTSKHTETCLIFSETPPTGKDNSREHARSKKKAV